MIKQGFMLGGRYEIVNRIGTGGMADVYKAVDRVLNRYVAIKVLKKEFREDENFVSKFRSEAQSAAGLQHPNIVNVYDVADDNGIYYIVMELVEGITLKDYIQKKGKLTSKEVIGITMQVSAGIESAHSNQIIHRDIKPQNIIISKEGKVKVTDFGIAKATSSNTISTNAMGSVHYTSPEQARGGFSDVKSDIYSLGITMYEMITGQLPFDGDSTVTIALKHLQEDIVPPSELVDDVPHSLEQIILKCTQKSPDRRYTSVALLIRDLKHSIQEPDGDFVKISPLTVAGKTRMITPEELEEIQKGAEQKEQYDEEYDDEYYDEYDDRERRRRKNTKRSTDIAPGMTNIMKTMAIIAAIIFVIIMGYLIAKIAGWGEGEVPQKSQSSNMYVVPAVVGKTEEEARELCTEVGLVLEIVAREPSTEYDENIVTRQVTSADTKLVAGAKLQVYVSSGLVEEALEIPDVSGMTEKEAIIELVNAGFKKKNMEIKTMNHPTIEKDAVAATEPEIGNFGDKNTKITIYLSTGDTEMPYVLNMTKADAEKAMEEAGLKCKFVVDEHAEAEKDQVVKQGENEGIVLEQGSEVEITISAGNKIVTVPSNLVGKHYMDVIKALEDLGFIKISTDGTASTKYNEEIVVSVDKAGQKVSIGTEITIIVSEGPGPGGNDDNNNETDSGEGELTE